MSSVLLHRFFIDTQPLQDFVVSAEDQHRMSERAHRFSIGSEGAVNLKKRPSVNEIKPAVRKHTRPLPLTCLYKPSFYSFVI